MREEPGGHADRTDDEDGESDASDHPACASRVARNRTEEEQGEQIEESAVELGEGPPRRVRPRGREQRPEREEGHRAGRYRQAPVEACERSVGPEDPRREREEEDER